MARGGFFAGLQRAARVAARENERRARQSAREHAVLTRRMEQTRKAVSRAQTQLAKASAADRKLREKEAQEAHVEARLPRQPQQRVTCQVRECSSSAARQQVAQAAQPDWRQHRRSTCA
jgi:hypothetical protein